ncbi:hypothetical protein SL267_22000 [Serratia marcescens]|nr:hypothetical protein SL267_22000 [Serratia marcescens]
MGVKLLQRLPRGVRITEAGVLFEEARALLARAERLREAVQRAARGGRATSPSVSPVPPRCTRSLPNLLRRYRDILPGITTQLEEAGSGELMEALLEQRLDAAFVRSPANGIPGLSVEPVLSEPMIVALPLGHRLAQETQQLPLAELAHEAFILYRARPARGCTTPSWPLPPPVSARASMGSAAPAGHYPQPGGRRIRGVNRAGSMRRLGGDGIVYRTLAARLASAPLPGAAPQPGFADRRALSSVGAGDRGAVIKSPNGQ